MFNFLKKKKDSKIKLLDAKDTNSSSIIEDLDLAYKEYEKCEKEKNIKRDNAWSKYCDKLKEVEKFVIEKDKIADALIDLTRPYSNNKLMGYVNSDGITMSDFFKNKIMPDFIPTMDKFEKMLENSGAKGKVYWDAISATKNYKDYFISHIFGIRNDTTRDLIKSCLNNYNLQYILKDDLIDFLATNDIFKAFFERFEITPEEILDFKFKEVNQSKTKWGIIGVCLGYKNKGGFMIYYLRITKDMLTNVQKNYLGFVIGYSVEHVNGSEILTEKALLKVDNINDCISEERRAYVFDSLSRVDSTVYIVLKPLVRSIFFTGSHGTGKTTIVNALANNPDFKDYRRQEEICRQIIKEGQLKQGTEEFQEESSLRMYRLFNQYQIISDRLPVIDIMAYNKYFGIDNRSCERRMAHMVEAINKCSIFFTPIEFELVNDGIRYQDKEMQYKIQENILELLKEYNIKYTTLSGSTEERIEIVKSVI